MQPFFQVCVLAACISNGHVEAVRVLELQLLLSGSNGAPGWMGEKTFPGRRQRGLRLGLPPLRAAQSVAVPKQRELRCRSEPGRTRHGLPAASVGTVRIRVTTPQHRRMLGWLSSSVTTAAP